MIMSAVEKLIKNLESYYDMITSMVKLSKVLDLPEENNGEISLRDTQNGFEIEFKSWCFTRRFSSILTELILKLNLIL